MLRLNGNVGLNGNLNVGIEVIEAGIDDYIKFVNDNSSLFRTPELKNLDIGDGYFVYNVNANNKLIEAPKGKIYAYLKIDYLVIKN